MVNATPVPPVLDRDVHLRWVTLHDSRHLADRAVTLLSADERERAERFRFPWLRADFALSRAILRILLGTCCGCRPADVTFQYGPQGKPALAADSPVRFNLAHSGGIAVYAMTAGQDLGVDVEQTRAMPDLEAIARRFFSAAEYTELMSLHHTQRAAAFFDCWVRKEAYIKAVGGGMSIPLDTFRVSLAPGQPAALLDVRDKPLEARDWSFHSFSPSTGYHGAVAIRAPHITVRQSGLDADDLLARAVRRGRDNAIGGI